MQLPVLCAYSDATYSVAIVDAAERNVGNAGPFFVSWMESGTCVSTVINEGLMIETEYVATIRVATLVGQAVTRFTFSEYIIYYVPLLLWIYCPEI